MSTYKIGSFNIRDFSYKSNKKEQIKKDCNRISEIINGEDFDVVALQEVWNENALANLLMPALGTNKWDYIWQDPPLTDSGTNEGYAFIWRKRRLRLADQEPFIYNRNAKRISSIYGGPLARPPFIARFTPDGLYGGSFFEIRLINTHIRFGKKSDHELRKLELKVLSEEIYNYISSKGYGDARPAYTFLLGDYNLCLNPTGSVIKSVNEIEDLIKISKKRNLRTVQREKSTIKKPKKQNEVIENSNDEELEETEYALNDNDIYSENYDHFSFDDSYSQKMKITTARINALEKYPSKNMEPDDSMLSAYFREVSDHVPIKLEIDLRTK